jgi:hypothetical protein
MVKFRSARLGVVATLLTVASLLVSGFAGSTAGAAGRANAKFCRDYQHDRTLVASARNASQLQAVVPLMRKLAQEAPQAMRNNVLIFAGDFQAYLNAGGRLSKSKQSALNSLSNTLLAQTKAACR